MVAEELGWPRLESTLPRSDARARRDPGSDRDATDPAAGGNVTGSRTDLPPSVARILHASDGAEIEGGWAEFLERYSRLLLHVAHARGGDYDDAMDRYAFVLEGLRSNDFRRFRTFDTKGRGKFSTWLVVVARRLCTDFHRSRYGRTAAEEDPVAADERRARRALVDLLGERPDFSRFHVDGENPERTVRYEQLRATLEDALRSLDDRDRLLLALRFENELTGREIARIMRFSTPFHVYRRVNRVLDRLKEALEDRGIRDPRP